MLYRENSTGALGFVEALNHELCSASNHPTVDGGCMINEYSAAFMRLLGSRTMAPRESIPFLDPVPLTCLPLPIDEWPFQYGSALVTNDQVLVFRFSTA